MYLRRRPPNVEITEAITILIEVSKKFHQIFFIFLENLKDQRPEYETTTYQTIGKISLLLAISKFAVSELLCTQITMEKR